VLAEGRVSRGDMQRALARMARLDADAQSR
jgi:hypothetical protein